jgi:SAM-dependent methyltransferase
MLDVGCGKGQIGGPFADAGWHVVGIDPSPEACAAAAARGIEARQGTLASASLATEERFDVVVFHHSLEHSTDPAADLRRAAEALRPGGQILISVPNFGGWQARLFRSSWFHLDLPRHRTHFTPMGLGLALERAGLAAEAVGTTTSSVGLFASLEIAIRKRSVFRGGALARMALPVAFFTSLPARAVGRIRADGDTLHAVARARCATISR